jgi:hypothetical protein
MAIVLLSIPAMAARPTVVVSGYAERIGERTTEGQLLRISGRLLETNIPTLTPGANLEFTAIEYGTAYVAYGLCESGVFILKVPEAADLNSTTNSSALPLPEMRYAACLKAKTFTP